MEARVLGRGWEECQDRLGKVVHHLTEGGLVAMPTETVYGFHAIPEQKPILELQRIKARGPESPFLLLMADAETVDGLEWTREARELAEVFWPGALTLVLEDTGGRFPAGVRSPRGGVAVRVSPHPGVRAVLGALGGPVVSTSANLPGGAPALTAKEVEDLVESLDLGAPLWILDGGVLRPSPPSTIVDCSGEEPRVVRVGAIPAERLRCVLPELRRQA